MKRRDFIALAGGIAAWPLAARSQQASAPIVGFVRSAARVALPEVEDAFRRGLREAGWIEGQTVTVDHRYAEGNPERLRALVAELIRRPVAVIVGDNIAALATKAASSTTPIVFTTGGDPVKSGLVPNLNRPGGNVTGVTFFSGLLGTKRLELLRQVAPNAATVAVLFDANTPTAEAERNDVEAAAKALGQNLTVVSAPTDRDLNAAFAEIAQHRAGALLIGGSAFFNTHRERIVAFATKQALPAMYFTREAAAAGGLMSYGASIADAYRQAGHYTARILNGEKPGDLPVAQPTKFELVINLKAAKALGLTVPDQLLALADEVIE